MSNAVLGSAPQTYENMRAVLGSAPKQIKYVIEVVPISGDHFGSASKRTAAKKAQSALEPCEFNTSGLHPWRKPT